MSPAVRVGIMIFIALLLFLAVAWFLTGHRIWVAGYTITAVFDNGLGLTRGSEVRMAGVTIGTVEEVTLDEDHRAVVRMLINRRYRIPAGSRFMLRVGLLIGDRFVDIIPDREAVQYLEDGAVVVGEVPPRIEDLMPAAQRAITALAQTAEAIQDIFDEEVFQARLERSFANVERATARFDAAMAGIQSAVATIQRMVEREQVEVRQIVANVADATESLRAMTLEIERFVAEEELQADVREAIVAARRATESLERTVVSMEELVTDPEFQEDIRGTVAEAREATAAAREAFERVGEILGDLPSIPTLPTIPIQEVNLDTIFRPQDGRVRTTLSTTVGLPGDRFMRLGLFDIGRGNKLILQPGNPIGERMDLRYGIYASRFGLGLDYRFTDHITGGLNIYNEDNIRFDVQGVYRFSDNFGGILGMDDVLDDSRITLGVQLTR